MSRETVNKLEECYTWYMENKNRLGSIDKKIEFILKNESLLWQMITKQQADIRRLEDGKAIL